MQVYFSKMWEYELHSNKTLIEVVTKLPMEAIPDKVKAIVSHLLAAQAIWYARIQQFQKPHENIELLQVWKDIPMEKWAEVLEKNVGNWQVFIAQTPDFSDAFSYKNSKGEVFSNTYQEILSHLLLHSSYHRGQVIVLLRDKLTEVPLLDYVFFARNQF